MKKSDLLLLIPHFNNPQGLLRSLKSVKEKEPLDVLVVDDGSTEGRIDDAVIAQNVSSNLNINYCYLDGNRGIEHALNKGLAYAYDRGYTFIARLDCGDVCVPDRFAIQKSFLQKNKDIGIVGSFVRFLDMNNKFVYNLELPVNNESIQKKMFLNSMFIHPTIMFRREVLDKVREYPVNYKAAEDYAFFFEVLKYYKGANIPEYLVFCEINPYGLSIRKRKEQVKNRIKLIIRNFRFRWYAVYGLIRNIIICLVPYRIVLFVKSKLKGYGNKT
ncbi:glycosyltransferase [Sinomicrobium soli]|uniref:glycosyltransferase n=1 Tax=Sinomicrobium sp. N-1-3-6 TaxID=2219864 RepID=UPI000DCCCB07|nr:glycosyltransferase [Sinomicrobium sp. N-1-3-6]RAV29408.1 glycosyl transferase family 2 [Sinomicrobium sp. N-1-3-6]